MSGRANSREERARLRAARVEVDGRMVAVGRAHGARRTYDVYGCDCDPCRAARAMRARKCRALRRERAGKPVYDTAERVRVARVSARRAPVPELRVCELDECAELIPLGEGVTPSMYAKVRYHADRCRNEGRARKLRAQRAILAERQCKGCPKVYVPARKAQRFHDKSCALRMRHAGFGKPRETKVCECGCGVYFQRPVGVAAKAWATRRFVDAEHRRNAPGESRAGRRKAPSPVPSRTRKRVERKPAGVVFDGPPAPVWRPPAPVVVRVERTVPRPSFGLTRRSA